jgi:hypothetical protein
MEFAQALPATQALASENSNGYRVLFSRVGFTDYSKRKNIIIYGMFGSPGLAAR